MLEGKTRRIEPKLYSIKKGYKKYGDLRQSMKLGFIVFGYKD